MTTDAKIFNEVLADYIQQYIKTIVYCDYKWFILEKKRCCRKCIYWHRNTIAIKLGENISPPKEYLFKGKMFIHVQTEKDRSQAEIRSNFIMAEKFEQILPNQ